MVQRKKRTAKQRALLRYKVSAPVSIGETRQQKADRLTAAEHKQIRETRATIWATRFTCQVCHGTRCRFRWQDAMHEDPSRAQTRGLPPEQRFNENICGRVGRECHQEITENRLRVEFLTGRRWNGPVRGLPM